MLELLLLVLAVLAAYFGAEILLLARHTGSAVHEVEGLILLLGAAVLLTGACIVGKLNVIQHRLAAPDNEEPTWWSRRKH